MFDIEVFRQDPHIFYTFAKQILPSTTHFSPTHAFLKLLQDKQKLVRVYTQNIDNLEQLAGVAEDKLVQCHGSFATASCMRCGVRVSGEEIREEVLRGEVPKCRRCEGERLEQEWRLKGKKRKRKGGWDGDDGDDDEDEDIIEGIMKVGILCILYPLLLLLPLLPFHFSIFCSLKSFIDPFLARHNLLRRKTIHQIRPHPPRSPRPPKPLPPTPRHPNLRSPNLYRDIPESGSRLGNHRCSPISGTADLYFHDAVSSYPV